MMKRPTAASLKRVTVENLAGLGAERLAAILISVIDGRAELKRRVRMELAAEQGADHLAVEIDKRLATLQTSRSKVSWRNRPAFVRDLDVLRGLIAGRLAGLDAAMALDRMWLLMSLAHSLESRVRDKDGELAAVFDRAAGDIGGLIRNTGDLLTAHALVEAMLKDPRRWAEWLPAILEHCPPALADAVLRLMSERPGATPAWMILVRLLADAAGNVDAFQSTFSPAALKAPAVAAMVANRLLAAGRVADAGLRLKAAAPSTGRGLPGKAAEPDFDWETAWIDYLERSGQGEAAQAARWSSFERTLSAERARAFTRRLSDFEDVEAEQRAFDHVATHPDFHRALRFLMDWPAYSEAARMIQARPEQIRVGEQQAEAWAASLRARQPKAAHALLRHAAASAFRRRDFATCDRLTEEAEAILE